MPVAGTARISSTRRVSGKTHPAASRRQSPHRWRPWMPGVAGTVPDTGRQTRTLTMHDGGRLVERLLDEGKWFHHYRFDDPGPIPVADFTALIAVVEDGPDQSTIEWTASFEPVPGVPADEAAAAVGGFYQACLDRITALLGT
ncbi:SRPBCC family protein [Streptomyces sp. SD15]